MSQDNVIAQVQWEYGMYNEVRRYDQWACENEGRKPWSWASLPGLGTIDDGQYLRSVNGTECRDAWFPPPLKWWIESERRLEIWKR